MSIADVSTLLRDARTVSGANIKGTVRIVSVREIEAVQTALAEENAALRAQVAALQARLAALENAPAAPSGSTPKP